MRDTIGAIQAREILSGVGRPTVEVEVVTASGREGTASVPAGTSTGKYEAKALYDGGPRYRGYGVRQAVANVNTVIAPALVGREVALQAELDRTLIELDGTPAKERLGGNALLAVSLAIAKAAAQASGLPLFRYLGGIGCARLPIPLATVVAGGRHSPSQLDFEDFLISLKGFGTFAAAVETLSGIHGTLGEMLRSRFGTIPDVGGAYAPPVKTTEETFEIILAAVDQAGYAGRVTLGLDVVGSDLYEPAANVYRVGRKALSPDALINYFAALARQYPLELIEDPFHEDDFVHYRTLAERLPEAIIVGDDLFATNPTRVARGIREKAGTALLLKVNQIGTVTEAYQAGLLAIHHGYGVIVSLRSGDTTDAFIADLAVAIGATHIKLGGPVRGERVAKYNRLLAIEEGLGSCAAYAGNQ